MTFVEPQFLKLLLFLILFFKILNLKEFNILALGPLINLQIWQILALTF